MENIYYVCAAVIFGVLGLCIGSFLNVVIYRLPRGMNLAKPASHCPHCEHKLAWKDNIPLFSFIFLGGKCRYCKTRIPLRYFFVELFNCLCALAAFFLFYRENPFYAATAALAISVMICMGFCDKDNLFIPDSLQIALGLLGIAALFFDPTTVWWEHLIGLAVGGGFYLLFYVGSLLILKREGLGFGDVKLMAAMGLFLGWKKIALVILLGTIFALVCILIFNARSKRGEDAEPKEYPLAPYLTVAGIAVLLFGNYILSAYMSLFI